MGDVTYTDTYVTTESTFVDEAHYNENTGDLYVDLNNELYKYSNVPFNVWDDFKNAESAGNFYTTKVKPTYGPGEHIGTYPDGVEYHEIEVEETPVLRLISNNDEVRKYKVVFKVTDGPVREYNVQAVSVDDAVQELNNIAGMLGLELTVKEVTVYFE